MYPRLSDWIQDWFGFELKLPIKTFGFFLALAFVGAYIALNRELKRREALGQFKLRPVKERVQGPMPWMEVLIFSLVWAVVGYKLGYAFIDYELFYSRTDLALMSLKGFWLTGLIAGAAAFILKYREFKQREELEEKFRTVYAGPSYYLNIIVTIAFVGGILGSKIFANIEDPSAFLADPLGTLLSFDGLSFLGGLLVAGAAILWYVRSKGFSPLLCLDSAAPGLILGYAIGRIGCQMAGDGDWGVVNIADKPGLLGWLPNWMWSFTYPHNVAKAGAYIPGCQGEYCTELTQGVWPTPFYETLMGLLIFGVLWSLRKKLPYMGQVTGIYLILIGTERFLIEKIRVNQVYEILGIEFTQAEFLSSLLILSGIALLVWVMRRKKPLPDYRGTEHFPSEGDGRA